MILIFINNVKVGWGELGSFKVTSDFLVQPVQRKLNSYLCAAFKKINWGWGVEFHPMWLVEHHGILLEFNARHLPKRQKILSIVFGSHVLHISTVLAFHSSNPLVLVV